MVAVKLFSTATKPYVSFRFEVLLYPSRTELHPKHEQNLFPN